MVRALLRLLLLAACLGAAASQSAALAQTAPAADFQPIRGPLAVGGVPPFALTGGALLVFGGVFWLQRKVRRRKTGVALSTEARQPDAREVLARLAADYRQGVCSGEQLIVSLDDLLRGTLADQTGIAAQRLTSSELLLQAEACLDDHGRGLLKRLMALGDRVKFAAYPPPASEIEEALSAAASLLGGALAGPA